MRVRRSTFLIATLVAATMSLAYAGAALADAGSGDTSTAGSETTTDTKTPVDTSTKPPADTSTKVPVDTSTKPPVTTSAPVTETPAPVTEAPTTPVVTCSDTSTCTPDTPQQPELPVEPTCADRPDAADCIPNTPAERTPQAPGGGDAQLPFTGPGDVVLAIVLALLAGSGGILFMFGAAGREQLDTLNRRSMDSPSGFHLAYRELRKDQLDR